MSRAVLLAGALALAAPGAFGCAAPPAEGGPAWLALRDAQGPGAWVRAERWPPALGQPFALALRLCPGADGAMPRLLALDAQMPAHRHGMNYRPTLHAQGPADHRAEGLLWHMPGLWRISVELGDPARPRRLALDVELP